MTRREKIQAGVKTSGWWMNSAILHWAIAELQVLWAIADITKEVHQSHGTPCLCPTCKAWLDYDKGQEG